MEPIKRLITENNFIAKSLRTVALTALLPCLGSFNCLPQFRFEEDSYLTIDLREARLQSVGVTVLISHFSFSQSQNFTRNKEASSSTLNTSMGKCDLHLSIFGEK